MNFPKLNLNFDYLLTNGLKFGLDLVKKNVTKAVSDNAFKVVKNAVFGKNAKQNVKNNNIRLKAGDSVTFMVTKRGLKNIVNNDEEQSLLGEEMSPDSQLPGTCPHPKSYENQILCELCLKAQLKSKL